MITNLNNWALLHDLADHKFHIGDETLGSRVAEEFLLT